MSKRSSGAKAFEIVKSIGTVLLGLALLFGIFGVIPYFLGPPVFRLVVSIAVGLSEGNVTLATALLWFLITSPLWVALFYRVTLWRWAQSRRWAKRVARTLFAVTLVPHLAVLAVCPSTKAPSFGSFYRMEKLVSEEADGLAAGILIPGVYAAIFGMFAGLSLIVVAFVLADHSTEEPRARRRQYGFVAAVYLCPVVGLLIALA